MPDECLSVSKYPSVPQTRPVGEKRAEGCAVAPRAGFAPVIPSGHWTHPGTQEL